MPTARGVDVAVQVCYEKFVTRPLAEKKALERRRMIAQWAALLDQPDVKLADFKKALGEPRSSGEVHYCTGDKTG